jgi:arabinogalactan oligomer/maltooligosaccharide transport system substrate-binding protein
VGSSRELPLLQAALGDDLGLAVLPAGPNARPAGPVLQADVFAFSRVASPQETNLALELAQFMTNLQQQTRLVVEPIGRLPAHSQVRFRQTLSPLVVELARQSRTAAPVTLEERRIWNYLTAAGQTEINDLYNQALSGVRPTTQAVQQIAARLSAAFNLEREDPWPASYCPALEPGAAPQVRLWHSLENEEAGALARIAQNFSALCPGVTLELTAFDAGEIEPQYRRAVLSGEGPDILFESSRLTAQLAAAGLVHDVSGLVDATYLQRFIPDAEAALRPSTNSGQSSGRLYGLPVSVAVLALYYNTNLVEDPLLNLNEVPIRVTSERQFALPVSFFLGYWGFAPFGGFEFDPQTGAVLEDEGLLNWLEWLQRAQGQPGMVITADFDRAEDLFARGEAAYFVSGPWSLSRLRRELGEENFRVAPLPAGPEGLSSPILQVQGVMANPNSSEEATVVAVAFGRYLADPESQQLLLDTGSHVSAVVNVDLSDFPHLYGFREQAKVSAVVTATPGFAALEKRGDELFEDVLVRGLSPAEAVAEFREAIQEIHRTEVTER